MSRSEEPSSRRERPEQSQTSTKPAQALSADPRLNRTVTHIPNYDLILEHRQMRRILARAAHALQQLQRPILLQLEQVNLPIRHLVRRENQALVRRMGRDPARVRPRGRYGDRLEGARARVKLEGGDVGGVGRDEDAIRGRHGCGCDSGRGGP
jgi:hypothetical protein